MTDDKQKAHQHKGDGNARHNPKAKGHGMVHSVIMVVNNRREHKTYNHKKQTANKFLFPGQNEQGD
jgi:hypothetical protein